MSRSSGALRLGQSAPFVTQQEGNPMRSVALGAVAAGLCALTACNNSTPQENRADAIEANAENVADNLEAVADNTTNEVVEDRLENKADEVREEADDQADAVESNVSGM